MALNENIVLLNKTKTVYSRIINFLKDKEVKSHLTSGAYEDDIRSFFRFVLNKNIEDLSNNDLINFDIDDITSFRNIMLQQYSASTVNRKISSMRSLYHRLSAIKELRDIGVDESIFNVDRAEGEVNGYGSLTWDEAKEMIDRSKNHPNGIQKSLIVEIAARTGFRIESILSITWNDFYYDNKNEIWIIEIIGKRSKVDKKPIKSEFYSRILELKHDFNNENDKIFSLTSKTMRETIKKLCAEMKIDPRRNITFHSLKKMGVNYILETTGDVKAAQRYANHSNAATTLNAYAQFNEHLEEMPSLRMGEDVDISELALLSKEDLLSLIANSGETVKLRLIKDAKAKKF